MMVLLYSLLLIISYTTAENAEAITTSSATLTKDSSQSPLVKITDGVSKAWNEVKTEIKSAYDSASAAIQDIGKRDGQPDNQSSIDAAKQNELNMRSTVGMVEAHTAAPTNSTEKGFLKKVVDSIKNIFSKQ
ncbi:unnamed protein product [Auanema sp. JU1783]|nr:unnamed protein product [Auanema sp. JU1783]